MATASRRRRKEGAASSGTAARKIQSETDQAKRNEMIREAFKIHQDDVGHIPLHQQALAWAYSNKVSLVQLPNNYMYFKWITLKSN